MVTHAAQARSLAFALGLLIAVHVPAHAATPDETAADVVNVAVAADFTDTLKDLGAAFSRTGAGHLVISAASTGKLYAQIRAGAPYDVLLSADAATPGLLVRQGLAVAASRFTYARGKLVLWSRSPRRVDSKGLVLTKGKFRHLAIANPQFAPYGKAACATLRNLGLWRTLLPRIVYGEDIGQTFQFAVSGNAGLAFVALAQLRDPSFKAGGSRWIVPQRLYAPIDQQAVLLDRARNDAAAVAFMKFLHSRRARAIIRRYGYGIN
ncbi:MAG: molybdate ABC transporter substrate-binding protein [Gammaproteobacteria bacterium]|nr:molybdate ABC transporter substrate-binding protein [Gammaproteobacteria bacterium]